MTTTNKTDYHSDYASISNSMLGVFDRSPAEYKAIYLDRTMEHQGGTKQTLIGQAVHAICLEKLEVDNVIAVYDEWCFKRDSKTKQIIDSLNPGPATEFREMYPDRICLKPSDAETVMRCVESLHASPLGELLQHKDAKFEVPLYWKCAFTGMDCRCMPDFHMDMGEYILAYDLKCTEQIYPNDWKRVAKRFSYWRQEAHYSAGMRSFYGKPVLYKFWVIETSKLFRVSRRAYDTASRDMFTEWYIRIMEELARCYQTDIWHDKWVEEEVSLSVTPWDRDQSEDELEYEDTGDE